MATGDIVAQTFIDKRTLYDLDLVRVARFGAIGTCLVVCIIFLLLVKFGFIVFIKFQYISLFCHSGSFSFRLVWFYGTTYRGHWYSGSAEESLC